MQHRNLGIHRTSMETHNHLPSRGKHLARAVTAFYFTLVRVLKMNIGPGTSETRITYIGWLGAHTGEQIWRKTSSRRNWSCCELAWIQTRRTHRGKHSFTTWCFFHTPGSRWRHCIATLAMLSIGLPRTNVDLPHCRSTRNSGSRTLLKLHTRWDARHMEKATWEKARRVCHSLPKIFPSDSRLYWPETPADPINRP